MPCRSQKVRGARLWMSCMSGPVDESAAGVGALLEFAPVEGKKTGPLAGAGLAALGGLVGFPRADVISAGSRAEPSPSAARTSKARNKAKRVRKKKDTGKINGGGRVAGRSGAAAKYTIRWWKGAARPRRFAAGRGGTSRGGGGFPCRSSRGQACCWC